MEDQENITTEDTINTPLQEPAEIVEDSEDPKVKRYKEQLKGRELQAKQAEERAKALENKLIRTSYKEVERDNSYLLELYDNDPELAEKVSQEFGLSATEAIAKIKEAAGETNSSKTLDKEALFKEWEERQEQKQALNSVMKHFEGLSTELKEQAKDKFNSIVAGRKLKASELSEIAEMASLYVQKDSLKSDAKDKAIIGLSSTPLSRNNSTSPSKNKVEGAKDLAEAMGLGHLYS